MSNWIDVAAADELKPGDYRVVETDDDILIAVVNVDGECYAIEDTCTHDGGTLTGGPIEGDEIVCPRHGARFCLKNGRALTPPAYEDVSTHPVKVEGGRLLVCEEPDEE